MLEAVGFPVAVNPEVRLGDDRPQAWLAGRAVVEVAGRLRPRCRSGSRRDGREAARPRATPRGPLVKALLFERKVARYRGCAWRARLLPGGGARVGPAAPRRHRSARAPGSGLGAHPAPPRRHLRQRPRDRSTARSSRYFEPIVSFPFVPGHEVVADRDDGTRVVHRAGARLRRARHRPLVRRVRARRPRQLRAHRVRAHRARACRSGFCCDTGGGWSTFMVAHESQLHARARRDERRRRGHGRADRVCGAAVHGERSSPGASSRCSARARSGSASLAALRQHAAPQTLIAGAKHPQQRALAADLGADLVVEPDELARAVRRATGSLADGDAAHRRRRRRPRLRRLRELDRRARSRWSGPAAPSCSSGMPGSVKLDLTTLWHRETKLVGAYAYGTETLPTARQRRTFDLAFDLVRRPARAPRLGHLPLVALSRRDRARRQRRPARRA